MIRNNTLIIVEMLLGLCRLNENKELTDSKLGVVRDDRLERIYYWIMSIDKNTFFIEMPGERRKLHVTLDKTNEYPVFDECGFIKKYYLVLTSANEEDCRNDDLFPIIVDRKHIPNKMWYITAEGKRVDFEL